MDFSFLMFLSLMETVLLVIERTFEAMNLMQFYTSGDFWWFGLTLGFIVTPGLLEMSYWVTQLSCFCGEFGATEHTFWTWITFGALFPVSIVFRHARIAFTSVCRGNAYITKKYSELRMLKSLQSFSENAGQIVLQGYIMIRTWQSPNENWLQMACIILGVLTLSKSCAEHHYHEVSAKEEIPGVAHIIVSFFYYCAHVIVRCLAYSVMFAHFGPFGTILGGVQFLANLLLAHLILTENFFVKTFWTGVASLVAPICFASRHAVHSYEQSYRSSAEKKFQKFYHWNCGVFTVNLLVTSITLNLLSHYCVIGIVGSELGALTFGVTAPPAENVMSWGSITWVLLATFVSLVFGVFTSRKCAMRTYRR